MRPFFAFFGVPIVVLGLWLLSMSEVPSYFLAMSGLTVFGGWLTVLGRTSSHAVWKMAQRWLIYVSLGLFVFARLALDFQRNRLIDSWPLVITIIGVVWGWQYLSGKIQWE